MVRGNHSGFMGDKEPIFSNLVKIGHLKKKSRQQPYFVVPFTVYRAHNPYVPNSSNLMILRYEPVFLIQNRLKVSLTYGKQTITCKHRTNDVEPLPKFTPVVE